MRKAGFAADKIFILLQDLRWHDTQEVAGALSVQPSKAKKILEFLERFKFVEYDGKKARIDKKRLEWIHVTE
jgi:DNA-binding IclR family transcriptional regulator